MHGWLEPMSRVGAHWLALTMTAVLGAAGPSQADEPLFAPPAFANAVHTDTAGTDADRSPPLDQNGDEPRGYRAGDAPAPPEPLPGDGESSPGGPVANQLWLINTRRLPRTGRQHGKEPAPQIDRYDANGKWSRVTLAELNAAFDPRLATVLLVHGNHTEEQTAISKGLAAYRALTAPTPDARPVRLLIWSWPTDFIPGGVRRDARVKAEWAEDESYYLARFVTGLDPRESVTLVGYSFGARAISGALHLLGGGKLDDRQLAKVEMGDRAPLRAVLLAAAVDDDWLLPGHRHGRALTAVERMVVTVNPQDRVLRWYRFLVPRSHATALGSHGVANRAALGRQAPKLVQLNAHQAVGGQHGWSSYIGSPEVIAQLRREMVASSSRRHRTASRP